MRRNQKLAGITGQKDLIEEMKLSGPQEDPMKDFGHKKIIEREDKYHQRRMNRMLSPERVDAFKHDTGSKGGIVPQKRTYYDIITEQNLQNERADVLRKVAQKEEEKMRDQEHQERLKRQKLKDDTTSTGSITLKSHA